MMHELGHNLNFYHSNVGKNEYADESCYMGGPQYVDHSFLRVILRWATFNFRKDPYDGFGFPRKAFVSDPVEQLRSFHQLLISNCRFTFASRMDTNIGYRAGLRIEP